MNSQKCIDEELLAAYFDGLLTDEQEDAVLRQALSCDNCKEALAAVAVIINETDEVPAHFSVPERLTDSAMALFDRRDEKESALKIAIRWLEGALSPMVDSLSPQPQTATVTRGAAAATSDYVDELRYNVTLGNLPLIIDLEVDGPDELALSVKPVKPTPPGTLMKLSCQGETRAISSLSADGATVSSLSPGRYSLSIEQSSQTLGKVAIELVR